MARLECPRCRGVIAAPRGPDKVRLARTPVVAFRLKPDGSQVVSMVCPHCKGDAEFPIPIPARYFRRVDDLRRRIRGG